MQEALSSNSQPQAMDQGAGVTGNTSTREAEMGGSLGFAGYLFSPNTRFQFSERHCLKNQDDEPLRETTNTDLWPL